MWSGHSTNGLTLRNYGDNLIPLTFKLHQEWLGCVCRTTDIVVCKRTDSEDSTCNSKFTQQQPPSASCSGVGSSRALRGPQIQVVGVALIIEFCDHNKYCTFSKGRTLVIW